MTNTTIKLENLSRIMIGKSENMTHVILIQTKFELDDDMIYNEPFGSNRMRFNKMDMFHFTLKLVEKTDDHYIYILTIMRDPHKRGPFFWGDGWTLDLKISLISKRFNILDSYDLYANIPDNYGSIILNHHDAIVAPRYKIGIMIPTFGRYEYLKKCFRSLKNTILDDCILVIIDESLTKEPDEDKKISNQFISNYDIPGVPIIKIFKNKHGNMFDSILTGFDILVQSCDYLTTIDSDTIHKKNWIQCLLTTYSELESTYPDKPIVLSGFNTLTHTIKKQYDNYSLKNTLGGCNMFFNKMIYYNMIRRTLISNKWDTNIANHINEMNGILAVTVPSIVEHIGEYSSVRNGNNEFVHTHDFDI